jgi:hypothetical protein
MFNTNVQFDTKPVNKLQNVTICNILDGSFKFTNNRNMTKSSKRLTTGFTEEEHAELIKYCEQHEPGLKPTAVIRKIVIQKIRSKK